MPTAARSTASASLEVISQSLFTSPQSGQSTVVVVVPSNSVVVVVSSVVVVLVVEVVVVHSGSSCSPGTQTPATHSSPSVQLLASLQTDSSASWPVQSLAVSSQVSLQSLSASPGPSQGSPAWAWHSPPAHESAPLQNTPSSHGAVLFRVSQVSVPSLQASSVHTSSSSQSRAVPLHWPPEQASFSVQNSPSSHEIVLLTLSHSSPASSHESFVQTFSSSQSRVLPTQAPDWHSSLVVQNWPSSQGVSFGAVMSAGQLPAAPVQASAWSHWPWDARHVVPDGEKASPPHAAVEPSQVSATSHEPSAARQTVRSDRKALTGQSSDSPSQTSEASQTPAAARQTVSSLASAGQAAPSPVQVSGASQT